MEYDAVTDDQWSAIKSQYLTHRLSTYRTQGFSDSRIKTMLFRDECLIMERIAEMQAAIPNWLTPRRQRILAEIR